MKKILIVNNNMDAGGIQKSLLNLLNQLSDKYDISLLLFSKSGIFLKDVPDNVRIVDVANVYNILGLSKNDLKKQPILFLLKAFLKLIARIFNKRFAMKLLGLFQKEIRGFDVVISFSHLTHYKSFNNGVAEFVLDKTVSNRKICFIHCDYLNSGLSSEYNNMLYFEFDKLAFCSQSVKERFLSVVPDLEKKCFVQRNFYDLTILEKCNPPFLYDLNYINLIIVARLSKEKGVIRFFKDYLDCGREDIRVYYVGDGPLKKELNELIEMHNQKSNVFILGEKSNPYVFMNGADYLVVPSEHEAAPMVFDEARLLGLSVISTNTTSAAEMLGNDDIIDDNLLQVLKKIKKGIKKDSISINNELQIKQFSELISK